MLNRKAAEDQAAIMLQFRDGERERLDRLHSYLRGNYRFTWLDPKVPPEVKRMAEVSRVNVLSFVVDSVVQSMYVDGFRAPREADDQPAWDVWQRNKMDARQMGVHRAALSYGASYVTILPGDPAPVLRGASPRKMTVVYGEDDDWPMWALEKRRAAPTPPGEPKKVLYRLLDEDHLYWLQVEDDGGKIDFISSEAHGVGRVPVVRFLSDHDLDDEVRGDVEPLIPLQEQINMTTFGLQVAQHYGAFKQRYIIGWVAESEQEAVKASAATLLTFEDKPEDLRIGEFKETNLGGYIDSREASLRHLATISQTPVHELIGQLVNLSAEALVAARESATRKLGGKQTVQGESWEQSLGLAGELMEVDTDPAAWVRWRDVEARSLAQAADALGKLAESLGIPRRALWERVPGVTDQEIQTWESMRSEEDSLADFGELLATQANG